MLSQWFEVALIIVMLFWGAALFMIAGALDRFCIRIENHYHMYKQVEEGEEWKYGKREDDE